MSYAEANTIVKGFNEIDNVAYSGNVSSFEELIEQGYSPNDALMLSGFGGYDD